VLQFARYTAKRGLTLLPPVNGNASVGALRTAKRPRLSGHKDLVRELVNRNAVGIGTCGHIDEPLARSGIDHAHHRPVRHIPTCCVVTVVAGVIPDFVRAAALINWDLAGHAGSAGAAGAIKDDQQGGELDTIVAPTADQEIVARALNNPGGHAIEHGNHIDNHRTGWVANSGIDFVNASYRHAGLSGQGRNSAIEVLKIKSTVKRFEG